MCGIVGYLGKGDAYPALIKGLKRLEYRGYDSAGVALISIPSFCGKGYYGLKVHEKALEYGVKLSGATVHFVNEEADAGAIILQGAVRVENDDTPETLQKRIMENVEWKLLPEAVSLFCQDKIEIRNNKAYIKK